MDKAEREEKIKQEYLSQTARIPWRELQSYFAAGKVIYVAPELDLVNVAVQLGMDNLAQFEQWTKAEQVHPVTDAQAGVWHEADLTLWAVVAAPWVLVQLRDEFAK